MTVNKEQNGSTLTVFIEGKLDAISAPQLEAELGDLEGVEELIFDLKDMPYTSSAGLRVFLNTQNIMDDQGHMLVRNASEDVMGIFKETGFTNILDIED
jgi:anti-sigma B factor antagonist